jgi:pyruvate/2-oxoglutarate dehydrogenase complex dihydrolipoamide acyltransferase (E2) component
MYNGTLAKLTQGKTVYTAYFIGEIENGDTPNPGRTPLEMAELPTETEAPTTAPNAEPAPAPNTTATPTEETTAAPITTTAPTETTSESGETNHSNNALFVIIPILGAAAGVLYYILKKRKGTTHNEKISNITPVADDDSDNDTPGSGE